MLFEPDSRVSLSTASSSTKLSKVFFFFVRTAQKMFSNPFRKRKDKLSFILIIKFVNISLLLSSLRQQLLLLCLSYISTVQHALSYKVFSKHVSQVLQPRGHVPHQHVTVPDVLVPSVTLPAAAVLQELPWGEIFAFSSCIIQEVSLAKYLVVEYMTYCTEIVMETVFGRGKLIAKTEISSNPSSSKEHITIFTKERICHARLNKFQIT